MHRKGEMYVLRIPTEMQTQLAEILPFVCMASFTVFLLKLMLLLFPFNFNN